ncbi:MAG: (2Fe-2S) ferredoxin domain-containing protein [Flammeovirgaceae bacterium]
MAIKDMTKVHTHLFLCNGGTCKEKGAEESTRIIRETIKECGLHERVHTTKTLCNARCDDGPIVIVQPEGLWLKEITPDVARDFVLRGLVNNEPIPEKFLYQYGSETINSDSIPRENVHS